MSKVNVAMFGLDNAGKTSLVHAIGGQPSKTCVPTMGFSPHTFGGDNSSMGGQFELNLYDLGGAQRFRGIWRNYFADVHGIVFVIDSSDKERIVEAKEALTSILTDPRASNKPLLVMANKQDQPGAVGGEALLTALDLTAGVGVRATECVAVMDPADQRIESGMEWLLSAIAAQYQGLCVRIKTQTAEDKLEKEKQRRQQKERVMLNKKTEYIQARDVHYFFEHLAGRILLDMPKDPMSFIISELEKNASGVRKITTGLFGLDNAGKTSLVHAIGGQPTQDTTPTVGFVPHTFKNKAYEVVVFDIGGAANFRGIWHNYYADVHGIQFIVDASDRSRLAEAKEVLTGILTDPRGMKKPLLVMANKQDVTGAMKGDEVLVGLGLAKGPLVNVVECVGVADPVDSRIDEGMEWMLKAIAEQYSQLSVRIVQHLAEEKVKRRQKQDEQRARLMPDAPPPKDTRSEAEKSIGYIKETSVHYILERLAGAVLAEQPDDLIGFLLAEAKKKN